MASGSGTGTLAAAPNAVTAGELLAAIRAALDDAAGNTWTDAELLSFLSEAVREYSQHLPRIGDDRIRLGTRRIVPMRVRIVVIKIIGHRLDDRPWNLRSPGPIEIRHRHVMVLSRQGREVRADFVN